MNKGNWMKQTGVRQKLAFRSSLALAVLMGASLACNLPLDSASQRSAQATAEQQTLVAELVAKHNPSQPAPESRRTAGGAVAPEPELPRDAAVGGLFGGHAERRRRRARGHR